MRHVNDPRICRLKNVNRPFLYRLHFNGLLGVAAQRSGGVCLCAQSLNGTGERILIGGDCLPDSGVIVDVLRHRFQHWR